MIRLVNDVLDRIKNKLSQVVPDYMAIIADYQYLLKIVSKVADNIFRVYIHDQLYLCYLNLIQFSDDSSKKDLIFRAYEQLEAGIRLTKSAGNKLVYRLCQRAYLSAMLNCLPAMMIDIETAMTLNPGYHYGYYLLAITNANKGEIILAQQCIQRAIVYCPCHEQLFAYFELEKYLQNLNTLLAAGQVSSVFLQAQPIQHIEPQDLPALDSKLYESKETSIGASEQSVAQKSQNVTRSMNQADKNKLQAEPSSSKKEAWTAKVQSDSFLWRNSTPNLSQAESEAAANVSKAMEERRWTSLSPKNSPAK